MLGGTIQPQGGLLPVEAGGQSIVISDASLLFGGDYGRAGDDLLIRDEQGSGLLVKDYFAQEPAPPLMSAGGAALTPELVAKLVAAHTPVQLAQVGPLGDAPAIGQVEAVTGTARAIRGGRPVDLAPGDPVFQNDVVETGLASELVIGFADGTIFSLAANARMLLDALVYDPAGSANELGVSILQGVFSFVTGQIAPSGEMLVETPVATLGIRGTTVHGVLQSIAGPLTVYLGNQQQGTEARVSLLDPLSRGGLATLVDLNAAYFVSGLGAPPLQRPQSAAEQQFTLQRAGVIHDVQSSFGFRYGTGEPINQPGEALRTQAGPIQPSGGIGFDRESGVGEALEGGLLQGLEKSSTLAEVDALAFSLLDLDDPDKFFASAAISARVEIAEVHANLGEGNTSSGQIVFPGGSAPVTSFALAGLAFSAGGSPLALASGGTPVDIVQTGNQAQGFAAGVPVFRFQLNADGSFTFTLLRPLDHPNPGAVGAADTIQIRFDVLVSFIDGSVLPTSVASIVLDSGPVAASDARAVGEADGLGVPVVGTLPILGGGDGVRSVELLGLEAPLTSGGQPITLVQVANDTFLGVIGAGAQVFRLVFDPATGNYSFTLLGPIDHPGAGADSLDIVFRVSVTDGDGDSAVSTIAIAVLDDVPQAAANQPAAVQEGALDAGQGTTVAAGALSLDAGGDGARIVALSLAGQAGVLQNGELVIAGAFFELRVDTLSGDYVYTLTDNTLAHAAGEPLVQSFAYTIRDGDGDIAVGHLEVRIDDDGPTAQDDSNTVVEGDDDGDGIGNQVGGNVIKGRIAEEADRAGADSPARVTEVRFGEASVMVPADNSDIEIEGNFGTLSIRADGTYTYTAPKLGGIAADQTETFEYTIVDGDGDSDSAKLTIELVDARERVGALLVTDSDLDDQVMLIVVTRDDAEILASAATVREGLGQETAVTLADDGIVLAPSSSYALVLQFASLEVAITVTDFDLIFDLDAQELDAPSNVFLSLLDGGEIRLGNEGDRADGVIWQVEGGDLTTSPPIIYDVEPVEHLGAVAVFDSAPAETSFALDFGLLPTQGNLPAGVSQATALFGDLGALDITGSQDSETNTLTIHADDVLDVGLDVGTGIRLVVLGDNDTVLVADPWNWVDGDPSTARLDPVRSDERLTGSDETFDVYQTLAGAELFVDDDLILQAQLDPAVV